MYKGKENMVKYFGLSRDLYVLAAIIGLGALFTACGYPVNGSRSTVDTLFTPEQSTLSAPIPIPTIVPQIAPTPTESLGGVMSNSILYIEYSYYELEGIPPYLSHYVEIDFRDIDRVDMSDPRRSRYERRFKTRENPPREGLMTYWIGTGSGGTRQECDIYDGQEQCVQKAITDTLTYDAWLAEFTRMGHRAIANINQPSEIGGYEYKGIQIDSQWGDVYVFERKGVLETSDLYPNYPMIETLKFDKEQLRRVEWIRMALDGDKSILHSSYRLVEWKLLKSSEAPSNLFDLGSK